MNSFGKAVALMALGCLISQMCGCASSSSLVNIWHDPSFQAPPLGKMLVIAVRKNAAQRRIWEDAFAGDLSKHGVMATPSYSLFPDSPPDTNQVISAVQANDFDGILVVLTLPTETDTRYVSGYTSFGPYWPRYWKYYSEIWTPGYTDSQSVAIRSIDVTTTGKDGRLIWSATSRTPDPGSVTDLQSGIAALVTGKLAQVNIIRSRK